MAPANNILMMEFMRFSFVFQGCFHPIRGGPAMRMGISRIGQGGSPDPIRGVRICV